MEKELYFIQNHLLQRLSRVENFLSSQFPFYNQQHCPEVNFSFQMPGQSLPSSSAQALSAVTQTQSLSSPSVQAPTTPQVECSHGRPTTGSQPSKVKCNDKALPSGAIEERLSTAEEVIGRYPKLKGSKLPTLAVKLAKEAFFGEKVMRQCTPMGSRDLPGLPTAELNNLKDAVYKSDPRHWTNIVEFETVWSSCIDAVGQACKRLRNK